MEIYLIRHTRLLNSQGLCFGQSELNLHPDFEEDAALVLDKLPVFTDALYCSPAKRCTRLAEKIGAYETDDRLEELNFGSWEMQKWADIPKADLDLWMDDYVNRPVPGGESYNDLFGRVRSFWEDLLKSGSEKIFVVTHAGVIRSMLSFVLEIPLNRSFRLKIDQGSVSRIGFNAGEPVVHYINL
jgi:alpha-ribazole phosphatase